MPGLTGPGHHNRRGGRRDPSTGRLDLDPGAARGSAAAVMDLGLALPAPLSPQLFLGKSAVPR